MTNIILHKFVENSTLKEFISQYKPFLLFLGKFFLSYLVLTIIYQIYLSNFDASKSEVDSFTYSVAEQTKLVLNWFDASAEVVKNEVEPSVKVLYKDVYVCRIIEGCNALSVIILFIAFVIAFAGKLKQTLLFIVFGAILIHILNIFRIAILTVLLYHYPQHEHILHGVVFPLVIYGIVFLLWVIWVNKFSLYATENTRK